MFSFYCRRCMFFILCYCSIINVIFSDCTLDNPSESKDEKVFLDAIAPLKGILFHAKDDNYTYVVSICSPIKNEPEGFGAIQYNITNSTSNYTIGRYDKADIIGGTNWIILTYYGGKPYQNHCNNDNRTARIMIACDTQATGDTASLRILNERKSQSSNCHYLFELSSNVSCTYQPNTGEGHLSSGSVFCILFFTAAIVYLVCGFLYQRIFIGAKGMEQIPNYNFWMNFGNLQADGCDYFCRFGRRRQEHAYRGIDEHLRTEEDRDDQLLN